MEGDKKMPRPAGDSANILGLSRNGSRDLESRSMWRVAANVVAGVVLAAVIFPLALSETSVMAGEYDGAMEVPSEDKTVDEAPPPLDPEEAFEAEEPLEIPPTAPSRRRLRRGGGPGMQRPGGGPGGPGGAGGPGGPGYLVSWYPSQSVSGQSGDLGLLRQSLSAGMPVWMGEGRALMFNVSVRNSHFSGDVVLPDTGRAFPADLWNVNFGLNYMHQFDNGWNGMLMTGIGTSGDEPFQRSDELNAMLGGMLMIPARNQRDSWTVGVMYSPGGTLNFPIPMLAYSWNPSDVFQMNVGLPLSIHWEPANDWTVDASYAPLTNANARITYSASETLLFYGGYENISEAYFLSDRLNSEDRFFVFEQRLITGVQWTLWNRLTADLHAGYAFERKFGEGENQGSSLHDQLTVSPGAFVGLSMQIGF